MYNIVKIAKFVRLINNALCRLKFDYPMMHTQRDIFLNNRWKRILIVLSAFFLMYLISYVINPFDPYWNNYTHRHWASIFADWGITFSFCFLISESSIIIGRQLNRVLTWTAQPGKRFAVEMGLNLLLILFLHLIIHLIYTYWAGTDPTCLVDANASLEETQGIISWIVISSMIAFVIIGINMGNYLVQNWINVALEAAELNQVAMESELQALKLQIDPHFVFNNLSVLSELILEDQQLGYEYAENFAKIYRYLLVNSKKDVILLDDELKFLHSYMFLIEHRFGEAVVFNINVSNECKQLYMPPLTLQLLVENALKHNKTTKKTPLRVSIYTNDEQALIIENALQPIERPLESSGIGIKNIIRRYHLLSEKAPQIIKTDTSFQVVIPLIKL